jgi:hypothetical protein
LADKPSRFGPARYLHRDGQGQPGDHGLLHLGAADQLPAGLSRTIKYATRISTDGVYLHQLDATVWAQGNTNVTHGCLNLNGENSQWFYEFSQPGDVVEVRNTVGEPLQLWQNGDWMMPWQQWLSGSALS